MILKSVELTADNIKSFDVVVLATDHSDFEYDLLSMESNLIVDARGKIGNMTKVIKA